MSFANRRDEERNELGVVWYRQWPGTRDGTCDDNGTPRPLTDNEKAEWDAAEADDTARQEETQARALKKRLRQIAGHPASTPNEKTFATVLLYLARELTENGD